MIRLPHWIRAALPDLRRRSPAQSRLSYEAARHRDDGSPDYLQWWYFDAELESGHHLMAILLPRCFGRVAGHTNGPDPIVTLTLTDPARRNHRAYSFYPGEFSADPGGLGARFGRSSFRCADGRLTLSLHEEGLGCELEYTPETPPWRPLPGRDGFLSWPLLKLMQPGWGPGRYFNYASMVPRARVQGTLTVAGREHAVRGLGYHEQGRTNLRLQDVFTYWYWTRLFAGDWTFIFPVAELPGSRLNAKMRALLVCHRGTPVHRLFDVTGLLLGHRIHSYQRHPPSGRDVPRSATFWARSPALKLELHMELSHEREAFLFDHLAGATPLKPAWFQHLMDVRVEMSCQGQQLRLQAPGVFESMLSGAV